MHKWNLTTFVTLTNFGCTRGWKRNEISYQDHLWKISAELLS